MADTDKAAKAVPVEAAMKAVEDVKAKMAEAKTPVKTPYGQGVLVCKGGAFMVQFDLDGYPYGYLRSDPVSLMSIEEVTSIEAAATTTEEADAKVETTVTKPGVDRLSLSLFLCLSLNNLMMFKEGEFCKVSILYLQAIDEAIRGSQGS